MPFTFPEPLQGAGMDLRGPVLGVYRYPTIVMFCEGRGIATARSLIEAGPDEGGLNFPLRQDVRLYYRVRGRERVGGLCEWVMSPASGHEPAFELAVAQLLVLSQW